MQNLVIISLGSNKGDWKFIFDSALQKIKLFGQIELMSSAYKTEPWGFENQAWFKNQIIGVKTSLSPYLVLNNLLRIEKEHGRNRESEVHWGPRTLDLDIILYENEIIKQKDLEIPHPRMQERRFILLPFCEIYPQLIHPEFNTTIIALLKKCKDNSKLEKI